MPADRGLYGQGDGFYRYHHIERGTGMMLKTVGLPPRGRLSRVATTVAWRLLQWRQRQFEQKIAA